MKNNADMERSDLHYLFLLKVSTISVSGIVIVAARDCETLQTLITSHTGLYISLLALERIFGFEPARFTPSLYTLDVLAKYCSYENWESFCHEQDREKNLSH